MGDNEAAGNREGMETVAREMMRTCLIDGPHKTPNIITLDSSAPDALTLVVQKQEAALKRLEAKHGPEYGKPPPGSKSEARAQRYQASCIREIVELCGVVSERGYTDTEGRRAILFSTLFNSYRFISDKCCGLLLRARRYKLLHFEGEMLFQGKDDNTVVTLLRTFTEIHGHFVSTKQLLKPDEVYISPPTKKVGKKVVKKLGRSGSGRKIELTRSESGRKKELTRSESGRKKELERGESGRKKELTRSESGRKKELTRSESGRKKELTRSESGRKKELTRSESGRKKELTRSESGRKKELTRSESGRKKELTRSESGRKKELTRSESGRKKELTRSESGRKKELTRRGSLSKVEFMKNGLGEEIEKLTSSVTTQPPLQEI